LRIQRERDEGGADEIPVVDKKKPVRAARGCDDHNWCASDPLQHDSGVVISSMTAFVRPAVGRFARNRCSGYLDPAASPPALRRDTATRENISKKGSPRRVHPVEPGG